MTRDLFAVQARVTAADYADAGAFRALVERLGERIDRARTRGAPALAVFPEEIGTFLALCGERWALSARTVDGAMARVAARHAGALVASAWRHRVAKPAIALLQLRGAEALAIYEEAFSSLARARGLTVVAGSLLAPDDDGRVYNRSHTYGPDGKLLAVTRKVNLVPTIEDRMGLAAGALEALAPVETPAGRVGTLICYDGFAEPHSRREPGFRACAPALAARGAEILAQPSANPWRWDAPWPFHDDVLRRDQWLAEGLWSQLPRLDGVRWVVNPQLVGRVLDQRFDGRSYVFARSPSGETTIAAQSRTTDEEELVHVAVDG